MSLSRPTGVAALAAGLEQSDVPIRLGPCHYSRRTARFALFLIRLRTRRTLKRLVIAVVVMMLMIAMMVMVDFGLFGQGR
jgi:hypothetical protein